MTTAKSGKGAKASAPKRPRTPSKPKAPRALRYENISDETDYYMASGVALLPSKWTLQLALMSPMLDERHGVVNTADVVVAIPWGLAKALAFALQQAIDKHDPTPLSEDTKRDISANNGFAKSLIG